MQPFQKWIISELYGWREKGTGNRRYNKAFISMARKNSKTYVASCIAIASLLLENKPAKNRQVLFVSNALKQAKIGYEMASSELRQVVKLSPALRSTLDIKKKQITKLDDDSFIVPVAGKAETLDGFNPTTAIIDEYHQAKDHAIYNVLKSGMTQQKNGLLCIISTSGFNLKGAMFEDYQVMSDILNGKQANDRQFIAIWELDESEEVYDQANWIKANPLFSEPHVKKRMTEKIQADVDLAIKQNNLIPVLVKNFNMWLQASEDSYISADDWAAGKLAKVPDLQNRDVYIGIDLSKSNDLIGFWQTDITYIQLTNHRWVYLATVLDPEKRKVLGYKIGDTMTAELPKSSLQLAFDKHRTSLIIHSDMGSQYTSAEFNIKCQNYGLKHSYSLKGPSYDNGRMEAFHSILKREEVYLKAYQTLTEVQAAIGWYINFYNRNRISNLA